MAIEIINANALDWLSGRSDSSCDLVYLDPPFFTQRHHGDFDDRWDSVAEYIDFLRPHISEAHRILSDTGNFLLHLDWRMASYARVVGDSVFGIENLQNEIIWRYSSGGASKRRLARKHDTLNWWSKSENYTFNLHREPYATPNTEGRDGFHPDGRIMTDVWDIGIISTSGKERLGYATQKPVKLLERIVSLFTNPGDTVVDFFAGSGTTGQAAANLGRNAILIDKNQRAVEIMKTRLAERS